MSTDPNNTPDLDQQLGQIQAISQNARTTWFGLIALNLFVGVTLMAHKDADFFARDAATKLPLLNIDVPVLSFFIAAPLLITAIHVYFQVYLIGLWNALGKIQDRDGPTPIADRVFPWLMSHAALRLRSRQRPGDGATQPRPMGWLVEWVSAALGWLMPLAMLAGLWVRSMPLHNFWLTIWIASCLFVALLVACSGYLAMRHAMVEPKGGKQSFAALFLITWVGIWSLVPLSLEMTWVTNGLRWPEPKDQQSKRFPDWLPSHRDIVKLLPGRARLEEVRLTPRPADWKQFDMWLADQRRHAQATRDTRWEKPDQKPVIPNRHEMDRWRLRIATLNAPALKQRDLRDTEARAAFLPGADLRGADLMNANLSEAQLQGADFSCASKTGGRHSACTRLERANLSEARMEGADLSEAQMEGADLSEAQMEGANLLRARMEGADLGGARIGDSDCTSAAFLAALVQSADLTCRNLKSPQIQFTVGDAETRLPAGMTVWSCLDRDGLSAGIRGRIDAVLERYPEKEEEGRWPVARSTYASVLFCDAASDDPYRRRPVPVGRPNPMNPQ